MKQVNFFTTAMVACMAKLVASADIVADSQNVTAPDFIGKAATSQPLRPKERFSPDALHAHIDGGNTRSDDYMGPLGISSVASSAAVQTGYMFWENSTSLLVALECVSSQAPIGFCLAALDPETMDVLVQWTAPAGRTAVSNYWQVVDNHVVMPTLEGFIMEIQRLGTGTSTTFTQIREVDVSSRLPPGSIIAMAGYTDDENLWFVATPAPLVGLEGSNTTTIGYVQPDGTIFSTALDNQIVENGMAVNGKNIYVLTGPAGPEDHADARGHFYAFQADTANGGGVVAAWNETYLAGSGIKPGGLSRGSGATPSLLGQKYVAMTDNADSQINLNVYRQASAMAEGQTSSFVCSVPLFTPGASLNEASLTSHFDGTTYSAMIPNCYNSPSFLDVSEDDVNGSYNNLTQVTPGVARVRVNADESCELVWDLPIVATMITLSTSNGILYAYTQDRELAVGGEYVWYIAAFDYASGQEIWRKRVGAGGVFNPGPSHLQLGANGRIYEGIVGGVAWVEDSPSP
ncbi:hypothetical protein CTAM01_04802 [Colletotrichum tamarilloi]|uniref:Pyrrolo-quinoline quinone n=1 Tax=Colletotrichum tamarilloi TaxID=1209934 RepID=A0ABQ9RH66_9PEZI|nr:uncharacterized protein CTAM01_04802 [Colletotrichum tamarilloi]KAK1503490.1 hypothetical protein CTAM01_04802 [Colletotrichum tamarilloi]